jgi:hypothetical protein
MINEKMVEFIKADWEAKRRAFEISLTSPFSQFVALPQHQPLEPPQPQPSPLLPQVPSTFPSRKP